MRLGAHYVELVAVPSAWLVDLFRCVGSVRHLFAT